MASESQLIQQSINASQNGGLIVNIGPINFTLIDAGIVVSITLISISALIAYLKKRK